MVAQEHCFWCRRVHIEQETSSGQGAVHERRKQGSMVGVSDEHVAQAQNRERASWGPREALAQFTINPSITKYNLFGSKILLGRREDHSLKVKGLGRFILKHPGSISHF